MNSPASCRPETPYQEQERERLTDPATQPLVGVPLSASRTDGLCIESPATIYIRRSRFIWVSCLHRSFASKGSNTVSISIKGRQVKRPFPSHQAISKLVLVRGFASESFEKTPPNSTTRPRVQRQHSGTQPRASVCVSTARVLFSSSAAHQSFPSVHSDLRRPLGARCWKKLQ